MKIINGLVIMLVAMVFALSAVSKSESFSIFESTQQQEVCNGLQGECYDDGDHSMEGMSFMMRTAGKTRSSRNLRTVNFISYDALKKDNIPCGQRGRSYYDCNRRGKANPYRRGCNAITLCARKTD